MWLLGFVSIPQAHAMTGAECDAMAAASTPVRAVAFQDEWWQIVLDGQRYHPFVAGAGPPRSLSIAGARVAFAGLDGWRVDTRAQTVLLEFVPNCGLGPSDEPYLLLSRLVILPGPSLDAEIALAERDARRWARSRAARGTVNGFERSWHVTPTVWWDGERYRVEATARVIGSGSVGCGVQTDGPCSLSYPAVIATRRWTRVLAPEPTGPGAVLVEGLVSEVEMERNDPGYPP